MALIFNIKDGDWSSVRQAIAKLGSIKLGPTSTPTFANAGITGLTTNSLIYSASGGILTSLGVATNGQLPIGSTGAAPTLATLTGTTNQVNIANAAGAITLSTPQDIHTGATVEFANLTTSGIQTYGINTSGGTWTADLNLSTNPTIYGGGSRLFHIHTTDHNIVIGKGIGSDNSVDGTLNVCIGTDAGKYLDSGATSNVFIGPYAGQGKSTGFTGASNICIGPWSGYLLTSATNNILLGVNTGRDILTADGCVAIGKDALRRNVSGLYVFGLGFKAGYNCKGNYNQAYGGYALYNCITGTSNFALGAYALNTTLGSYNVAIGQTAGRYLDGDGNTLIGNTALYTSTSSDRCVIIGNAAAFYQATADDLLLIDNRKRTNAAEELTNAIILGTMAAAPANQILTFNAGTINFIGNTYLSLDNRKIYLGTQNDSEIFYNGTNLVFSPRAVGAGGVTIGVGAAGVDYKLIFDGENNDGLITWMEDEDYFEFADAVKFDSFIQLTQKAGTAVDGDFWNDSTQGALQTFTSGIEQTLVGVIFTQTADQTIANTTAETSMFGTGVGTLTLPANFWTVGKTIRVEIHGDFADTGNPTAEVQAYYGATSLIDSGAIALSGLGGTEEWETEVVITCRSIGATGTVETIIDWEYETTTGSSAIERLDVAGVLRTIDTTAAGALDATFQWGTAAAANTLHSHVGFVEVLN